jgi:hypothetical protein
MTWQRGALTLHVLPMLDQDSYDRLLWESDLNFVRGEDSCLRAQFAARPMVWQAYVQEEDTTSPSWMHCWRCIAPTWTTTGELTRAFWRAWNRKAISRPLWPALAAPRCRR